MTSLLRSPKRASILDPGAGLGVFLEELAYAGYNHTTGVELDAALVAANPAPIDCASFIPWSKGRSFDAVIGNPPYVRWRDLSEQLRQEVRTHHLYRDLFNNLSDYLTVFIAASVECLTPSGELIFITPSFWMHAQHSAALREWLLEQGSITDLVDFGETAIFDGVTSSLVVFRFEKDAARTPINYYRYKGSSPLGDRDLSLDDRTTFMKRRIPAFKPAQHWALASTKELRAASRLESATKRSPRTRGPASVVRLGEYVDIANGMVTGLDHAFKLTPEIYATLSTRERAATTVVLKAAQMESYTSSIFTHYIDLPEGLDEDQALRRYPRLLAQLAPHRPQLAARYSYARPTPYYEWSFKRSEGFFTNGAEKGFVPAKERISTRSEVRFSTAPAAVVATQDVTAFAPKTGVRESIAYIVAYLNQPEVTEWLRSRGVMKGAVAEFSERPLANIPFRSIDFSNDTEIETHRAITALMRRHAKGSAALKARAATQIRSLFNELLFPQELAQ